MSTRGKNFVIVLAAVAIGMIAVHAVFAQGIRCSDVEYGNPNYDRNMERLARAAGLPGNYYSRYHQDVVSRLCSGDTKGIGKLVDNGFVKAGEVDAIAGVLGKNYKAKVQRSEAGKTYGDSKQKFLDMGLCNACADNVAQYYARKPDSPCGRLAKQALAGNPEAMKKLVEFPDFCVWKY